MDLIDNTPSRASYHSPMAEPASTLAAGSVGTVETQYLDLLLASHAVRMSSVGASGSTPSTSYHVILLIIGHSHLGPARPRPIMHDRPGPLG